MSFGSKSAAQYDVQFGVNTGQFRADMGAVGEVYSRTTGLMSDQALRAAVAQEKLDRALANHGPTSLAAKSATLAYRKEMAALAAENERVVVTSDAAAVSIGHEGRSLESFARGVLSASGALKGFSRITSLASGAFLGGAGLTFALREAINASKEHQVSLAEEAAALKAQGINYSAYRGQIADTLRAQEQLTGFTEEQTVSSFTKFLRATGDVNTALKATAIAAKVARGSGQDLDTITTKLVRGYNGQARGLAGLNIIVAKGAKGWAILEAANTAYANSSQAFANTEAGSEARRNLAIHETTELIGQGLIPGYKNLNTTIADWLDQTKNQKKIQQDVNTVIHDGADVIHGLVDAEKLVAPPIHAIISALGGLENAVELAFVAGIARKAIKAANSIGLIKAASNRARTAIVTDAAVEQKALETTGGVAAGVAAEEAAAGSGAAVGLGGALRGAGAAGLSALGPLGVAVGGGYALGQIFDAPTNAGSIAQLEQWAKAGGQKGKLAQQVLDQLNVKAANGQAAGSLTIADVAQAIAGGFLTVAGVQKLKDRFVNPQQYQAALALAREHAGTSTGGINVPNTAAGSFTNPSYISPAQQRANALALHPDSLTALGTQLSYDRNAIAFLTKRFHAGKIDGADYSKQLQALASDEASTQGQITSVEQAAAQKVADARARAKAKAAAAAKAYRTGISTQTLQLQTEVVKQQQQARSTVHVVTSSSGNVSIVGPSAKQVVDVPGQQKLIALYKKEANDKKLTENKRAQYAKLAADQDDRQAKDIEAENKRRDKAVAAAKKALAAKLAGQNELADAILQNALASAQLSETQAGTNAAALAKAQAAELRAQEAILAQDKSEAKHLSGLALEQNRSNQYATKTAIAQLKQQSSGGRADELSVGDALLANAFATAQLHETQAGTNAAKLKKAQAEELAVYVAQLEQEKAEEKGLVGAALAQKRGEEIATRQSIAELKNATAPAASTGANDAQFLSSFSSIISSFAPNVFPDPHTGKIATHGFETVNELRGIKGHLADMKKSAKFPGTYGYKLAALAAFG